MWKNSISGSMILGAGGGSDITGAARCSIKLDKIWDPFPELNPLGHRYTTLYHQKTM
jgi:hypothetical protein